jgi:hypothetical protein
MAESNHKRFRHWLRRLPLLLLLPAGPGLANDCLALMPGQVSKLGELKTCQSAFNGPATQYSCQDYQSGAQRYRVLYKGGLVPKAVVAIDTDDHERLIWSTSRSDSKRYCPLSPPKGVPAKAEHRGTGVCYAEDDDAVPCSVYEYAAARQPYFRRYIVFYNPTGFGYYHINGYVAGDNKNALVAEFAYQLGMSLLNTRCCSDQAMQYLEYAYRLFPKAEEYSKAYEKAKSILVSQEGYAPRP